MSLPAQYKDKFIGFVDVLGFKSLVENTETGTGLSLDDLLEILETLGGSEHRSNLDEYRPRVCPNSPRVKSNIDFRINQVSDSLIVSSEVSPAGVINLIAQCSDAVMLLLHKGVMCRGFITRGSVYHTDNQFIGSGFQHAYLMEKQVSAFKQEADEKGTPFVEIDCQVSHYIQNCGDWCVKEMYSRFVRKDHDVVALFPFKFISRSFLVSAAQPFQSEKELSANGRVRLILKRLKGSVMSYVDRENMSAMRKAGYYLRALDDQLKVCDQIEEEIKGLSTTIEGCRVIDVFPPD